MGFLVYNFSPAKIFMGDSGAYIIGFSFAVLSIMLSNFIKDNSFILSGYTVKSAFGLIASILIIPVIDCLRVMFSRIMRGVHPFVGDNNHIHHRMLKSGLSHSQSSLILVFVNFFFVLVALGLQNFAPLTQIVTLLIIAILLNLITFKFLLSPQKIKETSLISPKS
jgi:UDP-N-acetylmuramyl pentapeptide phosphotransferase/UDP-N-acetylglucosamine-1-phosphate transferase